ncbi:hypothetical protein QS306_05360 [Paraburkholderia bonniea]|nr:hypothetical protein [Paraburkholderia bonniea]WJF91077.1 hypothetical protein QS306_05360 [Paraburkholderia bonniea]WJF94392.1 hypothetical protein QS308_05365 [Paraburkholderia bonniea]
MTVFYVTLAALGLVSLGYAAMAETRRRARLRPVPVRVRQDVRRTR